jgi:hypothetical protein
VLVANQLVADTTAAVAITPKMTPRGQIRVLSGKKRPASAVKKGEGARRPLWSEVVAKKKDVSSQPTKVLLLIICLLLERYLYR